jgi:hypothetical protein
MRTSVRSVGVPPYTGSCWTKSVAGSARCHTGSSRTPSTSTRSLDARRIAVMDLRPTGSLRSSASCAEAGAAPKARSRPANAAAEVRIGDGPTRSFATWVVPLT